MQRQLWKSLWLQSTLVSLIVGVLAYTASYHNIKSEIENRAFLAIDQWESVLASGLLSNKDSVFFQPVLNHLKNMGINRLTYFPNAQTEPQILFSEADTCSNSQTMRKELLLYQLRIGELEICLDSGKAPLAALVSPLFLTSLLILASLTFLTVGLTLQNYRSTLKKYMARLENRLSSPDDNPTASLTSKDPIVRKLETMNESLLKSQLQNQLSEQKIFFARQVAHDLKGPIAALKALSGIQQDIKQSNLLSNTVTRLEGMSKELITVDATEKLDHAILNEVTLQEIADELHAELVLNYPTQKVNIQITNSKTPLSNNNTQLKWCFDRLTLSRILSNFVSNSVEASASLIFIQTELVNTGSAKDLILKITISDNGNGITVDNPQLLFERRFTQGKKNGEGLGLWFVKSKVESVGGKINYRDTAELGAVFELQLPVII